MGNWSRDSRLDPNGFSFLLINSARLTLNSTATMWRVAEQGRMVALGWRRLASAVRQYQKNRECQGRRLVLKYGSPIRTEIWEIRFTLNTAAHDINCPPTLTLPAALQNHEGLTVQAGGPAFPQLPSSSWPPTTADDKVTNQNTLVNKITATAGKATVGETVLLKKASYLLNNLSGHSRVFQTVDLNRGPENKKLIQWAFWSFLVSKGTFLDPSMWAKTGSRLPSLMLRHTLSSLRT